MKTIWKWITCAYSGYERLVFSLEDAALLVTRLYLARVFLLSGMTKLRDWDSTLYLFNELYHVPLLPPAIAATMGAGGELVLPILLVLGCPARFAATGLFILNAVAATSYPDLGPLELKDHYLWGVLLGWLSIHGAGGYTVKHILNRCFCHVGRLTSGTEKRCE